MRRRTLLRAAIGWGLTLPPCARITAQESGSANAPPRENDRFVFAFGSREGEVITPDDLAIGEAQLFAYPMDPATRVVRSGSRLNQVMLVRRDPATLAAETRERSVEGIVAYSGVCSHTGCDVGDWLHRTHTFLCPCHDSEFDPADGARVETGPAPRRLAALPLRIVDGTLMAAGGFIGRVGAVEP